MSNIYDDPEYSDGRIRWENEVITDFNLNRLNKEVRDYGMRGFELVSSQAIPKSDQFGRVEYDYIVWMKRPYRLSFADPNNPQRWYDIDWDGVTDEDEELFKEELNKQGLLKEESEDKQ